MIGHFAHQPGGDQERSPSKRGFFTRDVLEALPGLISGNADSNGHAITGRQNHQELDSRGKGSDGPGLA